MKEHRNKIVRVIAVFIAQNITDEAMNDEYDFAVIGEGGLTFKLVVSVSLFWQNAVNDFIGREFGKKAIKAELIALAANGIGEIVTPSLGANIVTSKWIFKAKMHIDETLKKLKTRLVARGFVTVLAQDLMSSSHLVSDWCA